MPRPGGRGPGNFEKSKDFKGSMIRLIKNLKPWKYLMGLALTLAMISAILALVAPNRLSKFADLIGEGLVPDTEMLQTIMTEVSKNEIPKDIVIDGVTITVDDQMKMINLYQQYEGETDQDKMLIVTPSITISFGISFLLTSVIIVCIISVLGTNPSPIKSANFDNLLGATNASIALVISKDKAKIIMYFHGLKFLINLIIEPLKSFDCSKPPGPPGPLLPPGLDIF